MFSGQELAVFLEDFSSKGKIKLLFITSVPENGFGFLWNLAMLAANRNLFLEG